jgi:tetratricopeptide (TPR) repeat protein
MNIVPVILVALGVWWLYRAVATSVPRRVKSNAGPPPNGRRGIDGFLETAHLPGNLMAVLRNPPDTGPNNLVAQSLGQTFAHVLMEALPNRCVAQNLRASLGVQFSYALLPGRRHLYRIDVYPERHQQDVSRILDELLKELPALPLQEGALFIAYRVRVNKKMSASPVFPWPFAGLIDNDSSSSWEVQLEQTLGDTATASDELEIAPDECRRLLEIAPRNAHALWLMGALYRINDQQSQALEVYETLLGFDGWTQARLPRAEILLGMGRVPEALTELNALLHNIPEFVPALVLRADALRLAGDLPAALADLEKAGSLEPGTLPTLQVKAHVLFMRGDFDAAAKVLDEVVSQSPQVQSLLLRGQALASAGKLELARADFTRVLDLDPESAQAMLHLAQVSFELGQFDESKGELSRAIELGASPDEAHFLSGLIALRNDESDEALEAFDRALSANPVHSRSLLQRGQLYLARQQADNALRDFSVAVDKYPDSAEAWCLQGEARRQLGDKSAALQNFDEALARDDSFMGARFGRARVLSDQGEPRRALAEIGLVIARHPDWPDPRFFRANLLMKMGETELAILDLQYLREQIPTNPWPTQIMEVQALLNCDRYEEVLTLCDQILEKTPDFSLAWVWQGQAKVLSDGPDAGQECFDRALQAEPELAELVATQQALAAATYHSRREEFDAVIQVTTEILDDDASSIPALQQRAAAYWYSQQQVEAVEDFSAILLDHPEFTFARAGRGQVLAEMGDIDAALLDLNQCVTELEAAGTEINLAYVLSGRALTAIAREDWDSAEADLDRSLLLAAGNAWSMYHRGLLHHACDRPLEASWCFRLALVLQDPALPPYRRVKAQAYVAAQTL